MNILIIGCGKVGSRLAGLMSRLGHDVSIIDESSRPFETLPSDFRGITIQGVAIDEDVLRQAGIEGCDAIAAVTQDDNINIMVCQIASELFHVPTVLARVYDPIREAIFSQFNIKTICPTDLTVSSIYSILSEGAHSRHIPFGDSFLDYTMVPVKDSLVGKPISYGEPTTGEKMLFGVMKDTSLVALASQKDYILRQGDCLVYVTKTDGYGIDI